MRKRRFTPVLAWALWTVIVACLGLGLGLASAVGQLSLSTVLTIVSFFGFATVGALIVAYRPGNTIGWLFLAIGIGTGFTASSGTYVQYSALTGAHLPLAPTLDWLGNVIWPVNIGLGLYVLILFPDGHLLSPRWRPLIWALTLALVAFCVSGAFTPGAFSGETTINPYGITALVTPLSILGSIGGVLIIPCGLLAVAAIITRFWRSRGVQREQLKWVAYAAVLMAICIPVGALFLNSDIGFAAGFFLLPLGAGAAILRSRLYDIDVIINRTLVYGSLTALLAGVYFACVIAAQAVIQGFTGKMSTPPVILVATTLLVAALFNPLRHRIQSGIDRRFYRRKYDAEKTLATFSTALRSETDLTGLTEHLVSVVTETMRPAHISLWLSATERKPARQHEIPEDPML
jgi:hypothetical protein